MHICGTWEETRVPRENPCRHGRACKLHTDNGPGWELIFFLIDLLPKWRYSRTCCIGIWYYLWFQTSTGGSWNVSSLDKGELLYFGLELVIYILAPSLNWKLCKVRTKFYISLHRTNHRKLLKLLHLLMLITPKNSKKWKPSRMSTLNTGL